MEYFYKQNRLTFNQIYLIIILCFAFFCNCINSELNETISENTFTNGSLSETELNDANSSFLNKENCSTYDALINYLNRSSSKVEEELTWRTINEVDTMPFIANLNKTVTKLFGSWKLVPGVEIQMEVNISSTRKRFYVDLLEHGGDIPLHVNPRFFITEGEPARGFESICLSTRQNGNWMSLEAGISYPSPFPIKQDVPFQLRIICETGQFRIEIDRNTVGVYGYRLKVENIEKLSFTGSGSVSFIKVGMPKPNS